MASIVNSPNGHRRIQFYDADKNRQTIPLGKCSKSLAESVKKRVESLLVAKILGGEVDQADAVWIAGKGKHFRPQLARVGLIPGGEPEPEPQKKSLDSFLDEFVAKNSIGKKPATIIVWKQAIKTLKANMPQGILLADVTIGHAKHFHEQLKAGKLGPTTAHKRLQFATQFFQYAVEWKWIKENPFKSIKNRKPKTFSNVEVRRDQIDLVMAKCNSTWKAIVALSRYGGLRCPSETLSLTWGDIDWENSRMSVPEPKVAHHEGRGIRSCPLFPELRSILEELFKESTIDGKYPSPESFVIDKPAYRAAANTERGWANANLRTQFLKILTRARVAPWPRLFHSMRATRQTELEAMFPLHVVCSWLGNSESVAKDSYLLVTEGHFQSAIKPNSCATGVLLGPKNDGSCAIRVMQTNASKSRESQELLGNTGENEESQESLAFSSGGKGTRTPSSKRRKTQGRSDLSNVRGTPALRSAYQHALKSISQSQQHIERLLADVGRDEHYTLSLLGPILANLKDAQSTLDSLLKNA